MSKSKLNVKSRYKVNKVKRVMRMKDNDFEPATYEIYKVTGPNKFKKYFCSRADAYQYITNYTNTKMSVSEVTNLVAEIKRMK